MKKNNTKMQKVIFKKLTHSKLWMVAAVLILSCNPTQQPTEPTAAAGNDGQPVCSSPAPEWDRLLIRNSGWFGGDGIFAVPMDGAEYVQASEKTTSLFIFSDSVVADTVGETIQREDFVMVHNCVAYLEGAEPDPAKMKFYIHRDEAGKPTSLFVPATPNAKPKDYYWMGDGFVNVEMDSTLYVFAYPVRDTVIPGSFFEFEQLGVNLIAIPKGSKPPFENQRQLETPFFFPLPEGGSTVTMGSGVMVNTEWAGAPKPDGYIYITGTGGHQSGMILARVKPKEFEQFDKWEFASGNTWTTDRFKAKPATRFASNEMSLSPMPDGRYILAHQYFGIENDVAVQISKNPAGPYFPVKKIWNCKEWQEDLDYFVYNAKGYPHFSKPGELLISYNVNSLDFWNDIKEEPRFCRPRFIKVKY